jgi:hypothetical protein
MADAALRSFSTTDPDFFATFVSLYPQTPSWQQLNLCNEILSAINSALSCTRPMPESFLHRTDDTTSSGRSGKSFSTRWDQSTCRQPSVILTYATHSPTTSDFKHFYSLHSAYEPVKSHPAINGVELARWMKPITRYRRQPGGLR